MGSVDISIDVGQLVGFAPADVEMRLAEVLDAIAFDLGELIDETCPVDTGAFQADWDVEAEYPILVIRNAREYAEWVHIAGTDVLYWTEVQDEANRLLDAAVPEMRAIVARAMEVASRSALPSPPPWPRRGAGRDLLFAARALGLERTPTRLRERLRPRERLR